MMAFVESGLDRLVNAYYSDGPDKKKTMSDRNGTHALILIMKQRNELISYKQVDKSMHNEHALFDSICVRVRMRMFVCVYVCGACPSSTVYTGRVKTTDLLV